MNVARELGSQRESTSYFNPFEEIVIELVRTCHQTFMSFIQLLLLHLSFLPLFYCIINLNYCINCQFCLCFTSFTSTSLLVQLLNLMFRCNDV